MTDLNVPIEHLKKRAKALLAEVRDANHHACDRVRSVYLDAREKSDADVGADFGLMRAQHVIAKELGFESWEAITKADPIEVRLAITMERIPLLNAFGIGDFDGDREKPAHERQEKFQRNRQRLRASPADVAAVVAWLHDNLERTKTINKRHTSYGMKHIAEHDIGYVTNGAFIAAVVIAGYPYKIVPGSPNVPFGFSEKSLKEIERRRAQGEKAHSAVPATMADVYILEHLYDAAEDLFERRPETRVFTASVSSRKHTDVRVRANGEVAVLPTINVKFVENTPAHWWFDGELAFIDGELYDGREPVRLAMLETKSGRHRVEQIVRDQIRSRRSWFAKRLAHFEIKSARQNGDNLVVLVSLALVDSQELAFRERLVALQKAHGLASIEMSKGALNEDLEIPPKRLAIAEARDLLAKAIAAAETKRQKETAERARGYERTWSLWEESLDRIDARRTGALPASHPAVQAAIESSRALRETHGTNAPNHRPRTKRTPPDMRNRHAKSTASLMQFVHISGTTFEDTTWRLSNDQGSVPIRVTMQEPITRDVIIDAFHREFAPFRIATSTNGGRTWRQYSNDQAEWDWIETVRLASSLANFGVATRIIAARTQAELIRYAPSERRRLDPDERRSQALEEARAARALHDESEGDEDGFISGAGFDRYGGFPGDGLS